jgi:hypothetical protein
VNLEVQPWTPGPWHVEDAYGWIADTNEIPVPVHTCFCEDAYEGDPTAQANNHLIAAAPDLYAALSEIAILIDSGALIVRDGVNRELPIHVVQQAINALAKAKAGVE